MKKFISKATQRYNKLPAIEKDLIDRKVEAMTKEVEEHEAGKDRNFKNMLGGMSKEVSDYAYRKIVNGVGYMRFSGIGNGKKNKCSICEQHDSTMTMRGSKWYCEEHKSMWNLTQEEQEHERSKYYVSQ